MRPASIFLIIQLSNSRAEREISGNTGKTIDISAVMLYGHLVEHDKLNNQTFSYSERWRYKGSEKPRQPLVRKVPT